MLLSRRHIIAGTAASIVLPEIALAARKPTRDFFGQIIGIKGTIPANPADVALVPEVLKHISTTSYVDAMRDLAKLGTIPNVPKPSTGEPWNRRWTKYANPLLVRIWQDMGYPFRHDCTAWCGVTLGWCLKRCGVKPPRDCASSQSYLTWGSVVTTPQPGDICVFTNKGDASHGHVTIFEASLPAQKAVRVLGANQALSVPTNCPGNLGVNVVDERVMALDTSGHKLNRYVRPA